jgi:hypothetical protein
MLAGRAPNGGDAIPQTQYALAYQCGELIADLSVFGHVQCFKNVSLC